MLTKIFLTLTLIAYAMLVSQAFMYVLALKTVQLTLDAEGYITLRKLIDASMSVNFRYVVYATLAANLVLVISVAKQPASMLFITAIIALVALVIDILITLKGNVPINAIINSWSLTGYPKNWAEYRMQWLNLFQYRQIAVITGFVSLVIGAVFRIK